MKKVLIVIFLIILFGFMGCAGFYVWGIHPKDDEQRDIVFVVSPGTSKTVIAKNLEKAGVIRSEYALDMYLFFHKITIQAGEYELSPHMSVEEILNKFAKGDVRLQSNTVTFVEGKRLVDYAALLEEKFSFTKEDFIQVANDREYLKALIDKGDYWFLKEDILNETIYYPLEGYLYPNTYEFLENVSAKEVIETLLSETLKKITPLKSQIEQSGKSVHEILTMASIIEKEAVFDEDRKKVAQVFYSRLEKNMSLGSDVTAFYGAKREMGTDAETWDVLNDNNPYNTRLTDGTMNGKLPIGPIANPSMTSIEASINKADTNYLYFVANVCTKEVFFQENYEEFIRKVRELQASCSLN